MLEHEYIYSNKLNFHQRMQIGSNRLPYPCWNSTHIAWSCTLELIINWNHFRCLLDSCFDDIVLSVSCKLVMDVCTLVHYRTIKTESMFLRKSTYCDHAANIIDITVFQLLTLFPSFLSLTQSHSIQEWNTCTHRHKLRYLKSTIFFSFLYHNCYFQTNFTSLILICVTFHYNRAVAAIRISSELPYTCNCWISNIIYANITAITKEFHILHNIIWNTKNIFYPNILVYGFVLHWHRISSDENVNVIENYLVAFHSNRISGKNADWVLYRYACAWFKWNCIAYN